MPGHQAWLPAGASSSCLCVNRFLVSVLLNLLKDLSKNSLFLTPLPTCLVSTGLLSFHEVQGGRSPHSPRRGGQSVTLCPVKCKEMEGIVREKVLESTVLESWSGLLSRTVSHQLAPRRSPPCSSPPRVSAPGHWPPTCHISFRGRLGLPS